MSRRDLIRFRRGTAATWTAVNPVLGDGEVGFETDTRRLKVGNGVDTWIALAYVTGTGGAGVTDHGALLGLTDDDHPQYLNVVRGDARYPLASDIDTRFSSVPVFVLVATGTEPRPVGVPMVFWIGGTAAPANMAGNDLWFKSGTAPAGDTTAPGQPTALASSNVSATAFTVSWTAPADNIGVTGYEVRVNGVTYATPTTTSQSITGRSANTTYSVDVRARDAANNWGPWSAPLSVTTSVVADTTPPNVPTGLTSSNVTSSGFTVSWTAPSDNVGVTGYEVFIDGVSYGTTTNTSLAVTGRNPNTAYSVTVRARDAANNWSTQSAALGVTTSAAAATHKVFGAAAPPSGTVGNITRYTDGPAELYVVNSFYATSDGWTCKGARVWIPAGALLGTQNIIVRAYKVGVGSYVANYDAPTQTKTIANAALVAGAWNEVTWDTPFTFNRVDHATAPEKVWIGFNWQGAYLHSPGVNDAAVQAADGSGLFLSGVPTPGSTTDRATNRAVAAGTGLGHVYYSVDIIADGT